ncbi:Nif11-like leader peptide family natural product precursor [Cyanobium sp. BA5m-10]|nr:Nif11-like leader peptide family natural product precursor [Cyanobium sp. BA5m-10]
MGRCSEDAAFAEQVRACAGPSALLVLAQAEGLALDPRELRWAARELRAVCFPWNGLDGDTSYRRDWFERDAKISK